MLTLTDGERVYLGDVVVTDVELTLGQRSVTSGEFRYAVHAKVQRVVDARRMAERLPAALEFRRLLSMGAE